MKNRYQIAYTIHEGFCDNYFPEKRDPLNEFRLDMFYSYHNEVITLVMEIMLNDTDPDESKILNYITYIQIDIFPEEVRSNLEQFVRLVKFDEYLIAKFKSKVQEHLRRDISTFEYIDLQSDISYYNHLNNHYNTENRIDFPINHDCHKSEVEFLI